MEIIFDIVNLIRERSHVCVTLVCYLHSYARYAWPSVAVTRHTG